RSHDHAGTRANHALTIKLGQSDKAAHFFPSWRGKVDEAGRRSEYLDPWCRVFGFDIGRYLFICCDAFMATPKSRGVRLLFKLCLTIGLLIL
ncbi:MAG: hypothetical protein MJH10_19630, partial [Epibacterium sp.]|nr:hypothetical protein [Epibacterium sp.]